jgi:hypothetical protein
MHLLLAAAAAALAAAHPVSGGPAHHAHDGHHARRASARRRAPLSDIERERRPPALPRSLERSGGASSANPPLGPASNFYANLLQSMPLATATSPYFQAQPLAISNDVLGNANQWNGARARRPAPAPPRRADRAVPRAAYSHALANGLLAPYEPWTALRAAQLVPNGGMLLHQGALPIGMRRELVAFGKAPEMKLWGGDRFIPKAPAPNAVDRWVWGHGDGFTGLPDTD